MFPWEEEVEWIEQRIPYTLSRYVCSDVTSVVALGAISWEYQVRELADRTDAAPRVFVAGGVVSNVPREGRLPLWRGEQISYWLQRPDDAAALMARFRALEVDLVKGVYVPSPDEALQAFGPALAALIREAHTYGVPVSVHAWEVETAKTALRVGADILAHTVQEKPVDAELLVLAKTRNIINTTTAGYLWGRFRALHQPADRSDADRICGDPEVMETWDRWARVAPESRPPTPQRISCWEQTQQIIIDNIRALHGAGVRIAVGTDAGNIGSMHGASFHRELQLLSQAGLSPMEIIVAATRNGAEALRVDDDLGTLEVGKLADLVILEADPLADIANLNRIGHVMLKGKLIRRSELVPAGM